MGRSPISSRTKTRQADALAIHHHWLRHAEVVASRPVSQGGSPHPGVKVGAVLVDKKNREIASSSNRFAHGVDRRRPERYKDGSKSLWINCAEQLAIIKALRKRTNLRGATLYVTLEPCAVCAGVIAELQFIKKVYVPVGAMRRYAKLKPKWKESIEVGVIKLAEAGIQLTSVDMSVPRTGKKAGTTHQSGRAARRRDAAFRAAPRSA